MSLASLSRQSSSTALKYPMSVICSNSLQSFCHLSRVDLSKEVHETAAVTARLSTDSASRQGTSIEHPTNAGGSKMDSTGAKSDGTTGSGPLNSQLEGLLPDVGSLRIREANVDRSDASDDQEGKGEWLDDLESEEVFGGDSPRDFTACSSDDCGWCGLHQGNKSRFTRHFCWDKHRSISVDKSHSFSVVW